MKTIVKIGAGALIAAAINLGRPTVARANEWDQIRCAATYPMWAVQYIVVLNTLKDQGFLRDREYAHGLLNQFLEHREGDLADAIMSSGEQGAAVIVALRLAEARCLKAGVDYVFPEPPPPPQPKTEAQVNAENERNDRRER